MSELLNIFTAVIYQCLKIVLSFFAPARPLRPCLMFVGKAKTIPRNGRPGRCFTEVGSWPYPQILTWLGRLARENYLLTFVNYGGKMFTKN